MKMTLQTTLPPNPPPVVADKLLFTPPNPKIKSYKKKNYDMKNNYNLKVIGCWPNHYKPSVNPFLFLLMK